MRTCFPTGRIGLELEKDANPIVTLLVSEATAWIIRQILHSEGGFSCPVA